jgi:PAS domain S-box-containing protein
VGNQPDYPHQPVPGAAALSLIPAEQRYRSLVEAVKDYAIFLLDAEGFVASWNAGAERLKGYRADEIIGTHFSAFYTPDDVARNWPREELERAATLGRWEDEGWRVRKDKSRFWANVLITALRDEQNQLIGFVKVTRDLTERREGEEQLRQSEERLRRLMDAVEDAIFMLDPQGFVTSWNGGATRLKGFQPAEIIGQHFSRFYPVEDIASHKPETQLAEAQSLGRVRDEGWRLRKDGSRFWASAVITAVYGSTGELMGFAKVTRDMTERNRLQQLEHASELAANIETAREAEKKRIARELHDDLGQQLSALKMDLVACSAKLRVSDASPPLHSRIEAMSAAIDQTIASVRRIAAGLRPAVLDDLGLVPALEWLVADFRLRSGLRVLLRIDTQDVVFNDESATALFRIVQEGLTNIARHAKGVTEVTIDLTCTVGMCNLSILDDGVELAHPNLTAHTPGSSGLVGIRERARRLGGTALIGADPAGGFRIALSIPRRAVEQQPPSTQ